MRLLYRRSCGMDVHKDTIVVYVLPPAGVEGKAVRKTYGTLPQRIDPHAGVVEATQGNRGCNGVDRCVLAAGLECIRRGRIPAC